MPVIAGYLIWQRRQQIASATANVFWPGLLAVGIGILGYLTFSIGPIPGVHMGVDARNKNALSFYEHLGFRTLERNGGVTMGMPLS